MNWQRKGDMFDSLKAIVVYNYVDIKGRAPSHEFFVSNGRDMFDSDYYNLNTTSPYSHMVDGVQVSPKDYAELRRSMYQTRHVNCRNGEAFGAINSSKRWHKSEAEARVYQEKQAVKFAKAIAKNKAFSSPT